MKKIALATLSISLRKWKYSVPLLIILSIAGYVIYLQTRNMLKFGFYGALTLAALFLLWKGYITIMRKFRR